MNYDLLSLTELFLKIGLIGTITSILSMLLIPKKKKIINGMLIITIMFLFLEITGAIILLMTFDSSSVSSTEYTKVTKSNISSNSNSKSSTIKNNTTSTDKDTTSESTSTKNSIAEVHKNDNSTITTNTETNNYETQSEVINSQYDSKKGKYYIPKFNKYVDSEQGLYDTFNNEAKAVPFDYIETETDKEIFFGPASGPSSDYN